MLLKFSVYQKLGAAIWLEKESRFLKLRKCQCSREENVEVMGSWWTYKTAKLPQINSLTWWMNKIQFSCLKIYFYTLSNFLDLNTLAESLLFSFYNYAVMLLYIRLPHQPFFLVQFFLQKAQCVYVCLLFLFSMYLSQVFKILLMQWCL